MLFPTIIRDTCFCNEWHGMQMSMAAEVLGINTNGVLSPKFKT